MCVFLFAKDPKHHGSHAHIDAVTLEARSFELAGDGSSGKELIKCGKDLIIGMLDRITSSVKSPPD